MGLPMIPRPMKPTFSGMIPSYTTPSGKTNHRPNLQIGNPTSLVVVGFLWFTWGLLVLSIDGFRALGGRFDGLDDGGLLHFGGDPLRFSLSLLGISRWFLFRLGLRLWWALGFFSPTYASQPLFLKRWNSA